MSAYVVDDKTISALAKAFVDYGVDFKAENFTMPSLCGVLFNTEEMKQAIGKRLLEQNCISVNGHYGDNNTADDYVYEDVKIDEGIILGCIRCYNYQTCECEGYYDSVLYNSLLGLKEKLLERFIKRAGYEVPWGYEALELNETPLF